ncbi:MAG TPA: EamA family transporter, partial [Bacteroidota bacterium]|nr:EamA family transporter [Bacteroidota bacterium]
MTDRQAIVLEQIPRPAQTALLTAGALLAFAANSILCRLALIGRLIDPAGFAAVRLCSGAIVLGLLCALRGEKIMPDPRAGWVPGLLLFLYALPFTFAYADLPAGTGALLLFGAVQITMMLAALRSGYRATTAEWSGLAVAFGGLVYLTTPGVEAPPIA